MTKREFIQAKINIYKQWLLLLTNGNLNEESLVLPKSVSAQEEIDRVLDLMIELRDELKKLDESKG